MNSRSRYNVGRGHRSCMMRYVTCDVRTMCGVDVFIFSAVSSHLLYSGGETKHRVGPCVETAVLLYIIALSGSLNQLCWKRFGDMKRVSVCQHACKQDMRNVCCLTVTVILQCLPFECMLLFRQ